MLPRLVTPTNEFFGNLPPLKEPEILYGKDVADNSYFGYSKDFAPGSICLLWILLGHMVLVKGWDIPLCFLLSIYLSKSC